MLTDFGHDRVTSDHCYDALIKIAEGVLASRNVRRDILGAALAGLFRHRSKLRQRFTVLAPDIGEISQSLNTC